MKNIVICCDGTWNTPDEKDGGVPAPTNVVRLYNALAEADAADVGQHKYYHAGVGTNGSWWDKVIGGGTGVGLERNVMSAYRELCDYYEDGDRIYLFGFSRGAYTVRSLGGLVSLCGLLDTDGLEDPEIWTRIEHVFQKGYRRKTESLDDWQRKDWEFRENGGGHRIPIRFLGVWDTVGALGIPNDMAFLNLIDNLHDYTFHDTNLSASIQTARHAIALDERRASFQPTLWNPQPGQDALEMWFPGVHSDVGGGYRETGLSDAALAWMISEAKAADLNFNSGMIDQIKSDYLGPLHDSCCGVFSLLPSQPRGVPMLQAAENMHPSAVNRAKNPPIHQCPYRQARTFTLGTPLTIDIFAAQPWNDTGLWLEAGITYTFFASGEWMDSSIKCGPDGADDGKFQPAELAQIAGSALGWVESVYKKLARNSEADFRFTKRHEDMPWFCLVGAIANGGGVDAKGHTVPHEAFAIGDGVTYTPKKSGYFYAYANDAWNCYGNNRGRVQLTIR
ncbi:MAG TPA: DUF2235 domain-containing protein [Aromatoleum sp.]|uniref:DUF2235 domain-containing protein n=1 Tax=Aromatoleum sp. TaxID=2307007 RepID=UPI002B46EBDF|nr:DUF2235 domain-containing protein [Aromatoleum sp.]HJV25205.1 DUF2235 domain-containing protein [Aromatoleum sp.]